MDWKLLRRVLKSDPRYWVRGLTILISRSKELVKQLVIFSQLGWLCIFLPLPGMLYIAIFNPSLSNYRVYDGFFLSWFFLIAPLIFGLIIMYGVKFIGISARAISYPWKSTGDYSEKTTKQLPDLPTAKRTHLEKSYRWFFRGIVFYFPLMNIFLYLDIETRLLREIPRYNPLISLFNFAISYTPFTILTPIFSRLSESFSYNDGMILFPIVILPGILFAAAFRSYYTVISERYSNYTTNSKLIHVVLGTVPALLILLLYIEI